MKRIFVILLIVQMASVVLFLFYIHQADLAMGKNGVGNVGQFETFNKYAGVSFCSAVILWLVTCAVSLMKRQLQSKEVQLAIGVPPVVAILGWVSLWFI